MNFSADFLLVTVSLSDEKPCLITVSGAGLCPACAVLTFSQWAATYFHNFVVHVQ